MTAGITASAEVGDVIGNVYSTDILAQVNGYPIPSYSLNGKTAIALRDLENYGFYVEYYEDHRTAAANSQFRPGNEITPIEGVERGTVGAIVGNVLETDITAYINGEYVPTCNIGGTLTAAIEDIAPWNDGSEFSEFGYAKTGMTYTWDEASRTVNLITLPRSNEYDAQRLAAENMLSLELEDGTLKVTESRFADLHLSPDVENGVGGYGYAGPQIYNISYSYPDGTTENVGLFYGFYGIYWDEGGSAVQRGRGFSNTGISFDMDKIKKIIAANKPEPRTFEEELGYWRSGAESNWHINAELDTDDYVILDMQQTGLPPGGRGSSWLMRLDKDPLGRQVLVDSPAAAPELYDSAELGETDTLYYFMGTSLYKMNVFEGIAEEVCSATKENVLSYLKDHWETLYEHSDEYNTELLLRRGDDYRIYMISDAGVTAAYRGGADEAYAYNGTVTIKKDGQWLPERGTEFIDIMLAEGDRIEL